MQSDQLKLQLTQTLQLSFIRHLISNLNIIALSHIKITFSKNTIFSHCVPTQKNYFLSHYLHQYQLFAYLRKCI